MKLSILASAALVICLSVVGASALTLKTEPGPTNIEKVSIAQSATTADGIKLVSVGAGLRTKKVVFVNVKVYIGQLFVANIGAFRKNISEALKSSADAAPIAIQLHFLRDVDAEKVQSSFKDALESNKVDLKKTEIEKFLSAVKTSGAAKEGKSLTILGSKAKDGTETIVYEDVNGKATTVGGPAGFIQEIFAIWLGTPSDDGVAKLKAEILK
ncbi:MAG: chalcone isomerase family protein [Bdellovibrionaceae bacterium]|nr:chalcone isomerase family protein [Pseudobdellovibrionaceae bacterium]